MAARSEGWRVVALTWVVACASGCPSKDEPPRAEPPPVIAALAPPSAPAADAGDSRDDLVMVERDVNAIFSAYCSACHAWSTRVVVAMQTACGGKGSRLVVPFDVSQSRLFGKISGAPACGRSMPPTGGLPQPAIATFRLWIERGAPINGKVTVVKDAATSDDESGDPSVWFRED